MQPCGATLRLKRMKNELRVAAGLVVAALSIAGCGSGRAAGPQAPIMTHGVAAREPLVNPRPYGAADTAFGLEALGPYLMLVTDSATGEPLFMARVANPAAH